MPLTEGDERLEPWIRQAAAILKEGGLVAYPTDTVYGLGADLFNPDAIGRLYEAKGRPARHAIPVLLADASDATRVAERLSPEATLLASRFWPGPLTIIVPRHPGVPDAATGGGDTIGIRVPNHEVPRALALALGNPITGTSANSSGRPPHRDPEEVDADIGEEVDLIIPGECGGDGVPSTVVDCTKTPPEVLRQGAVSIVMIRSICPDAVTADVAAGVDSGEVATR